MKPWKTLSSRIVFDAAPFVQVSRQEVELPNGKVLDDFYQVHLQPFASIAAVQENGLVRVLRHYKHGPGRVCLGLPAGFIEPGEEPLEAARRELLEETGLASQDWISLGSFVDNGNRKGCEGHYFLARGCRVAAAPDSGDHEEHEQLDMTIDEVDAALRAGEFAVVHQAANWAFARPYL